MPELSHEVIQFLTIGVIGLAVGVIGLALLRGFNNVLIESLLVGLYPFPETAMHSDLGILVSSCDSNRDRERGPWRL